MGFLCVTVYLFYTVLCSIVSNVRAFTAQPAQQYALLSLL